MEYSKRMRQIKKLEKQKSLHKKEELLLQVKSQITNESEDVRTVKDISYYKSLYKKTKKEKDKFQRQYIDIKGDNLELQMMIGVEREKNKRFKKELFELERVQEEQRKQVNLLRQQLNQEAEKDRTSQQELELLLKEKELSSKAISKLHSKLTSVKDHNDKLKEEIQHLKKEYIHQLENRAEELSKDLNDILNQNKKYIQENEKLQNQLEKYQRFEPEFLLEQLSAEINLDNVFSFKPVVALHKKYVRTKRNYYRNKKGHKKEIHEIYGTFMHNSNTSYVLDTNGGWYEVFSTFNGKLSNGDPVACEILDNGKVHIYWRYDDQEMMIEDKKKVKIKTKPRDKLEILDTQNIEFVSNKRIAIVTSKNGKKYVNLLSRYGLNAIWIDAYEKSPIHVKTLMESCDIVLLCIDSLPHTVLDVITPSSKEKYHILPQHNEDIILNRVRLALLGH